MSQEEQLKEFKGCVKKSSHKRKLPGAGLHLKFAELDEELSKWVRYRRSIGLKVSRRIIQQKAKQMFVLIEEDKLNFKKYECYARISSLCPVFCVFWIDVCGCQEIRIWRWYFCSMGSMFCYLDCRGFPQFQPLAMLGGFLWCMGNLTALPIIKVLGLGMGILIWGVVNCAVGWAAGRFGLFGINPSIPNSPALNYAGLVLVIIGGVLFSLVRITEPQTRKSVTSTVDNETASLMQPTSTAPTTVQDEVVADQTLTSALKLKLIAIGFSMLAGACYGLTFVPVIYIQDNPAAFKNPPKEAVHYAFSHFSGIFATSTVILLVYLLYTLNNPFVNGKIILPSFFAGLLWSIAMLMWFVANDLLSQAITFPINAMMPGLCAALWSVFYFKEITGAKNLRLLMAAVLITLVGAALVGISKSL